MKEKILLCVSGGIAAYKAIELASLLSKAGFVVKTVLTDNAQRFVSRINFAAITHQSVHNSLFEDSDPIPHIDLADWADLIVVAPATANILAKAAQGLADDLLSTTLLAHKKPVLFVPAMNVNMYEHPATQANLSILRERGNHVLEPVTGLLACGYEGKGKYPPNPEIVYAVRCYLEYPEDLRGIKVLVTAGATAEPIDPMRLITNKSSGKMGLAIARAFALRGAQVTLVHGLMEEKPPYYLHEAIFAPTVQLMHDAVIKAAKGSQIIVKCAAVSDFKPLKAASQKIKKGGSLNLDLVPTPDILAQLGKQKTKKQKLIGFAAETEKLVANAREKLLRKNLDLICVNHLDTAGSDQTKLSLISADQAKTARPLELSGDKFEVALRLVERIIQL
ncbi:MAG: bifunctional phosphopantothenoylcysteine decarboxylase/phosphopantothenate--cysteine ligase CoaBC [Candidatus Cloacimonetes bacterium]|nr:bifunctional phosphopantothenoylcysteine decarboxylase/phosphopantothenate--cysteine ligase CoaBC [Candidatus Cloacimonadota bacterium]